MSTSSSSLSTSDAVAITGVVGGLCSFTAGLLLGVLLTRCSVHCHRKQKRGQTERPPVYEDIQSEMKLTLNCNTMKLMDTSHIDVLDLMSTLDFLGYCS